LFEDGEFVENVCAFLAGKVLVFRGAAARADEEPVEVVRGVVERRQRYFLFGGRDVAGVALVVFFYEGALVVFDAAENFVVRAQQIRFDDFHPEINVFYDDFVAVFFDVCVEEFFQLFVFLQHVVQASVVEGEFVDVVVFFAVEGFHFVAEAFDFFEVVGFEVFHFFSVEDAFVFHFADFE
jgi:hypothetical protein